jgi:hypothetical protein
MINQSRSLFDWYEELDEPDDFNANDTEEYYLCSNVFNNAKGDKGHKDIVTGIYATEEKLYSVSCDETIQVRDRTV